MPNPDSIASPDLVTLAELVPPPVLDDCEAEGVGVEPAEPDELEEPEPVEPEEPELDEPDVLVEPELESEVDEPVVEPAEPLESVLLPELPSVEPVSLRVSPGLIDSLPALEPPSVAGAAKVPFEVAVAD